MKVIIKRRYTLFAWKQYIAKAERQARQLEKQWLREEKTVVEQ